MIADAPRPFIFIHIPKTAGTSVEKALLSILTGIPSFKHLSSDSARTFALPGSPGGLQHAPLRWFEERGLTADRYIFSIVRNPYDRALSQVRYLRHHVPKRFKGSTWRQNLVELASLRERIYSQDLRCSQSDYLANSVGQPGCHRIVHFEKLEEELGLVWKDLGFDGPLRIGRELESNRIQPWWEFYDARTAEIIARRFKRDFELFGYSEEIPTLRNESGART